MTKNKPSEESLRIKTKPKGVTAILKINIPKGIKNMTIKTLTFIHELLKDELSRRDGAYALAARKYQEAYQAKAPNEEALHELQMSMFRKRTEARQILDEFEAQEW